MQPPQPGNLSLSAKNRLIKEFEGLSEDKTLGFRVVFGKDDNDNEILEEWDIYIQGPLESLYEGYVLHAKMHFPSKYPFQPPTFRFVTPMFHPNIYNDGMVCISILHTERDDPSSPDNEKYTWTPGQNVRTVCLSVISLLSDPNIYSPANVDASKMMRDDNPSYIAKIKECLKGFSAESINIE